MAKLLHILDSINPAFGGTVESVRQIIEGLSGTDHRVEVASLDPPGNPWLPAWNTEVYCLGPSGSFYRYSPRLLPWLRLHAKDYDGVVVNGLWRYPTLATYRALRSSETPYFIVVHGMLDPMFNLQRPKYLQKLVFWKAFEAKAVANARGLIYTSPEEMTGAREAFMPYRAKEELILNLGVRPAPDRASVSGAYTNRHPDLLGQRYLLFLGRIHPIKGCDILLEAFARCAAATPDCRLVIAGPDQCGWSKALKNIAVHHGIAERVTWTGPLYGKEKWDILLHADAFVLPSHHEAFPLAVLEALASGLPVLTTRKVKIWRHVVQAGAGLVGDDTLDSTASIYAEWFNKTDGQRSEMRQRAVQLFHDRFEASKTALRHVLAIQDCIATVQGQHIHETSPNCCS